MIAKRAVSLLIVVAGLTGNFMETMAARTTESEGPLGAMVAGAGAGDKVTRTENEGTTMFLFDEESDAVANANEANPGAAITHLVEIRSKLKFVGSKTGLKNPEMVPTLIEEIKSQEAAHPDSKFLFCLHVGTSADARIHTKRPGFMEGRIQSVKDAVDGQLGGDIAGTFEHLRSTRFAGFIMKVYSGDTTPECVQEDLAPPAAGAEEEEVPTAFVAGATEADTVTIQENEGTTMFSFDEDSAPVAAANEANPGAQITNLLEIRSKLKFVGSKTHLANPEMVPKLVEDIKNEQAQYTDSKFLFCLHVGTSADARIHTKRPGFMEGRIQTVKDAVEAELGGDITGTFEHLRSTRFAGFIMKVYNGDTVPECAQEDLIPPSA